MDDKEYNSYRLRAAICPGLETEWGSETTHWNALRKCANELRSIVSKGLAELEAIGRDTSLSGPGKRLKKQQLAEQALDALKEPASLVKARLEVLNQMKRWGEKLATHIKPAADHAEAILHSQVRQKVAELKEGRMAFLQKHAADPVIASALLEAPPFLSNLSEAEVTLLRTEVEKTFLSEEIIAAKDQVGRALVEVERSLRAGQAMIKQSAGLQKMTVAA